MKLFQLLEWVVLLHLFWISYAIGGFVSDKSILIEFKNSVSDPSGILSGWNSNFSDHCSWSGVSCDSNFRVLSLNFSGDVDLGNSRSFSFYGYGVGRSCVDGNRKLAGNLSPVIGKLSELRVLSISCNDFSGEIPKEIWGLGNLEVLDLEGNLFTGTLPIEFDGLRKLRVLNLGFNRISGEIPVYLSKCVGLEVLNLAGNRISGTIPGVLGSFVELQGVYLSMNQLGGSIPSEIGNNCLNLQHVDLAGNFLVNGIPRSLGNCSRLSTLLLFSNMLVDVIPPELGRLRMLEVLDVSRNILSGPIPVELGNCVELSVLVLSNLFDPLPIDRNHSGDSSLGFQSPLTYECNYFEGSIPTEVTSLSKLKVVWAPRATTEGAFPQNWGGCESLEMVNLAQNYLTGEIVGVFGRCKNLFFIDLSSNNLVGNLDEEIAVPCMVFFDVSGNQFSGSFPNCNYTVCHPIPPHAYQSLDMYKPHIESLLQFPWADFMIIHNFGGNNLTGEILWLPFPAERSDTQIDYAFLAGGNNLNGSFIELLFRKCDGLNGLIVNISSNEVSGEIPWGVGEKCKSLKLLDASKNRVSGSIPLSLGNLDSLVLLDLSRNNLNGVIPSSFGLLKSLRELKLSSNSLSGEIPQDLVKLKNLTVLMLDDNKLSGKISSEFANLASSLSEFNVSSNNLTESLPLMSKNMNSMSSMSSESEKATTSSNGKNGLSSIKIVSLACSSTVFIFLVALVCLFYKRKWVPNSRIQVSETRAITTFKDIGVPMTFEDVVLATGNFSASNCIGNGGFGATYKAEISSGTIVAIKRLSVGRFQGVQQFHAEVKTLGRVRHTNLVTLIGYHTSESEMFLIYNYLPGGNLENFIRGRSTRAFDWKVLHKIALDVARALAYLHDECVPRVLHRDVKPSNILLDDEFNAYLSDFGLSRLLGPAESHATTGVAGTFGYVAPEYAMTCRVSEKSDVYSYGVVLLELLSDKKALDPSFSLHGNGFNIVSWACMLSQQSRAEEFFAMGLWDTGYNDSLVKTLDLAIICTVESLTIRPTMRQVLRRLKQLQPLPS